MSFICMRIKDHFHINDSTLSLGWKQRLEATPKWPITTRKLVIQRLYYQTNTEKYSDQI